LVVIAAADMTFAEYYGQPDLRTAGKIGVDGRQVLHLIRDRAVKAEGILA
jgi:hypothetical protein